jgi:signal transduction histidine kinase
MAAPDIIRVLRLRRDRPAPADQAARPLPDRAAEISPWLLGLAAVVCLAAVAAVGASAPPDQRFGRMLLELLIVGVPSTAGIYALRSQVDRRFGVMLLVVGFAWSLTALAEASASVPYTIGRLAAWLIPPTVWYLLLVFPTGRLASRMDRALLGAFVAVNVVLFYGTALFVEAFPEHTPWATCGGDCPANALMVVGREPAVVGDLLLPLREALVVAVLVGVVLSLLRRWGHASPLRRRSLAGVAVAGTAVASLHVAFYVARAGDAAAATVELLGQIWTVSVVAVLLAFVYGLAQRRLLVADVFARVAETIRSQPEPAELRDVLAEALCDPSLELLVRDDPAGEWRDSDGRPAEPPAVAQPGRGIVRFGEEDGGPAVALVHDDALRDEVELLDAVSSMVIASWRHERVLARLSRAISEVEASRQRTAEIADLERVRIVRDLHDGAQQRLIALRIRLSMAEDQLQEDPGAAAAAVHELGIEAERAIDELRGFARGVAPPILNRGLQGALRVTADQAPMKVEVEASGVTRHPIELDSAVYFVCTEALQNAMKHARTASGVWISLREGDGELRFEVRDDGVGFTPDGTDQHGLRNMRDRIEAVGGTLHIDSAPGVGTRVIGHVSVPATPVAAIPARPAVLESEPAPPAAADDATAVESVLIYERLLPAESRAISDLRRELDGVLARHDVPAAQRADIGLTLSEAATNVVLHAYHERPCGPLYVAAALKDTALVVSVIDSGSGMRARPGLPGAGLGLEFMHRLSDDLTIISDESEPGTAVHATFESTVLDSISPQAISLDGKPERIGDAHALARLRQRRPG